MLMILCMMIFYISTPLVLMYSILGISIQPSKWRKYYKYLIISIAVISYSYNPIGTPDLVRYYELVNLTHGSTLMQAINILNDGLYAENILFWIVGRIGNMNLLAAISGTITYAISIYITCDIATIYKMERKIPPLIAMQMMILPFVSILCNVRCVLAFSLVSFAVYQELVKMNRKLIVYMLYVIAVFMHMTALIMILMRVSLIITKNMKWMVMMVISMIPIIIALLYQYVDKLPFGNMIKLLVTKVYWYFNDDLRSEFSQRISNSNADYINRLLLVSLAIIFIVCILTQFSKLYSKISNYITYIFMQCLATVACYSVVTPQYWRFSAVSIICGFGPVLIPILKKYQNSSICLKAIYWLMPIYSVVIFIINIWKCRYIVDYLDWGVNFILNNVYTIFFSIIKGLLIG